MFGRRDRGYMLPDYIYNTNVEVITTEIIFIFGILKNGNVDLVKSGRVDNQMNVESVEQLSQISRKWYQ